MLLKFIDRKIRQAFSDSAYRYEVLANLQKEIGRELTHRIEEDFSRALDVGMGTGWLTNRLKMLYPQAQIVGIDFADGMLEHAQKKEGSFEIVQGDARRLPFLSDVFEVIISNLAYQWIDDLPAAFAGAWASLKPQGNFYFTTFGSGTLKELFTALESCQSPAQELPMKRLAGQSHIEEALQAAGFTDLKVDSETIKVHFENMYALVKWLKDTGANIREKDFYVSRGLLARANEYYRENFKDPWGVYASFEIIWVKARKA